MKSGQLLWEQNHCPQNEHTDELVTLAEGNLRVHSVI